MAYVSTVDITDYIYRVEGDAFPHLVDNAPDWARSEFEKWEYLRSPEYRKKVVDSIE